jgi:hypothetical protein
LKKWVIGVVAVVGALGACCVGSMVLALLTADDSTPAASRPAGSGGGCASTVDSWALQVEPFGVSGVRGPLRVLLPWAMPFTNELRAGDPEQNMFTATLGDVLTLNEAANSGGYNPLLSGWATERATGERVFFFFVTASMDGIASPVAVIGPEADVRARFPSEAEVRSLRGLNQFPLSCADVEGHWKSGFSSVAERYAASTGQYLGTSTSAAWSDLKLESGSFEREQNAYVNGAYSKQNDSGAWSHDAWSLVLEPEGGESIRYKAAFVAVKSGFLLWLVNEKYSGDSTEFQRQPD